MDAASSAGFAMVRLGLGWVARLVRWRSLAGGKGERASTGRVGVHTEGDGVLDRRHWFGPGLWVGETFLVRMGPPDGRE